MTNLTTEKRLSELPLQAGRLVDEHRARQIVPTITANPNLLRGKKIGSCEAEGGICRRARCSAGSPARVSMPALPIDAAVFSDEWKATKCSQGVAIDLHFLEPRV